MTYTYEQRRGSWKHQPAQAKVLGYLLLCLEEGFSASVEQVRAHMGWNRKQSAKQCLTRMHEAGRLPANYDTRELLAKLNTREGRRHVHSL